MTYTCSNCGETKTEEIEELGHAWNEGEVTTAPTCSAVGTMTYTCTRCGETKTEDIAIDPNAHAWDSGRVTAAPTCSAEGVMTYTCTLCSATQTDVIPVDPDAHYYVVVVTEPTCTAGGYTTYTCDICGDSYTANETAALGHDWGEWVTVPGAGKQQRTCRRCGMTESKEISEPLLLRVSLGDLQGERLYIETSYLRRGSVAMVLTASEAVTFTSSDPKTLTVDADGNVRFVKLRLSFKTVTVTAATADGRTATCDIHVQLKWWHYIIFFLLGSLWY